MTFLEQLQESAGLLSDNIANSSPFGNYTPMQASDFVNTPFGQPIAQNRFEGNQFLMPDLTGSTYTPGNFSLEPGAGFNFGNFGSYTPQPFNQFGLGRGPITSPGFTTGGQKPENRGDGIENRDRIAAMRQRSEMIDALDRFNMLPGYEEPTLPGLLGIFESFIDNVNRDQQINNIMRDINASKDFGVNKFGLGTSYKGSSGIDRDPADMTSFGTPTTGPAARDTDLGKGGNRSGGGGFGGDNTGGRDASGVGGTGGRRGGAGPN